MNETLSVLMNHKSIRKFKQEAISEQQLSAIVAAGQMASSSSNVQAYSVIAVTEPDLKRQLAGLAGGQAYVEQCPVFLVWCADLYRLKRVTEQHRPDQTSYEDSTENFIVATIDAALAAQNAAIAAEAMDLGIVYIGGIRNNIAEVSELLRLPELVYPVFGMCVGVPDQDPGLRPRLPQAAVLHMNGYDPEQTMEQVELYDEAMTRYLSERTGGERTTPWSEIMAVRLTEPARLHMKSFLEQKGFVKR
ncbi:oxygen-insensitive NADPH nitroreductase [Paenibacillus sp. P96]|uniref:Oxygen-insensitive NADPH nitroreductase n=1 Tax=Paenibacillus zeirhizosphaerae TaxID=2987519 RepID=A0ABT9FMR7_9BACL|nr:oxygen-insensitive NADPH nitroreductase [Paenibacillus sp. P96]MDP4096034.1 oxygen-insensitive NADPH nitroreductase [Paenibacillus sp. P96]